MPSGAVLLVIAVAISVNVLVMAAIVLPPLVGRRSPLASVGEPESDARDLERMDQAALIGGLVGRPGEDRAAYDRIVRIVSWAFLLATAVIIGTTGLWPDTTPAIFVLLGLSGAFVLVVHDLMPPSALGAAKYVLEGTVALTFATFLVLLTGGHESPFFFTFPLIVGAAALVVRATATFVLAICAAIGYIVATTLGSGPPTPVQMATVAVDLTALSLLAYVGSVIGREQRRSRDAALRLSAIDPLTGLFNRSFFFAAIEREMARSARSGRGFCLLMLDLDELKTINDRAGHHAGDAALRGRRRHDPGRHPPDRRRRPLRWRRVRGPPPRDRSDRRLGARREDPPRGLRPRDRGPRGAADGLDRRRLVPPRRSLGRRAHDQRRPGDVRVQAGRPQPRGGAGVEPGRAGRRRRWPGPRHGRGAPGGPA